MKILLLGLLALATAAIYEGARPYGRGQRLKKKLNATARHDLEEHLHVNLTARGDRLKRMNERMQNKLNRKASSPRRMQKQQKEQQEVQEKIAELPQINPEKPAGVETVNLFERNDLEGTSEYMFQGDMHFTDEQLDDMESYVDDDDSDDDNNSTRRRKRQATTLARKWTGNTVYYYFDASLSTRVRNSVAAGHALITQNTCVNFVQSSTAANRVRVYSGNGCFSNVGMSGGEQALSLGTGCEVIGTAVHEFSHALGIFHTQMRTDRDSFVTINQAAIDPNLFAANFPKLTPAASVNYVPYEYGSDMHYPATAFAINPQNLAMVAKDPQYTYTMGGSLTTFYDLKNINDHYGCTALCAASTMRCQNGGTPNPRNCATCICPAGYGGTLCDQRPAGCGETLTATANWQTKQFSFGDTTNNRDTRDVFTMCNHWIQAPAGQRIVVKITAQYNTQCNYGCPFNGIEIKTQSQQITNPRLCCDANLNQEFTSNLNPTPLISFNRYYYTSFTVQYKTVGGTPSPSPVPAPGPSPPSNCQDDANCPGWVAQGFCTNSFYSTAQRQQYCPSACNLCTPAPAPAPPPAPAPAACVDTNAGCAGFVANGFCSQSFYTTDYKKATCGKSCNLC